MIIFIKFTGKKYTNKIYYRHTGHPGGIKVNTPSRLAEKDKIDDVLKLAVKRMLPGGPLAKKQLTKLKIYKGDKHPHEVQNPTIINFKDLNMDIIIEGVTGEAKSKYVIFDEISIGGCKVKNVIATLNLERDNTLIGVQFFDKFSNVQWDMKEKTLKLYR